MLNDNIFGLLIHANKLEHLWVCVNKCIQFILKQPPINIKAFELEHSIIKFK